MNTKLSSGFFLAAFLAVAVTGARAQTVDTVFASGLVEPHSVVIGPDGSYFITDGGGLFGGAHRIVRYAPNNGSLITLAGDFSGQRGTNDGAGFVARFFGPAGIALARGGLVVADSGNHTIRFVGFDGRVTTLAGAPGQPGSANGAGSVARFNTPLGLAADAAGNVFIADSKNNVIRKLDTLNIVTTYATGFNQPNGVALGDSGELWVADTLNHQIKSVAPDGSVSIRAGTGQSGVGDAFPNALNAQFSAPRALWWMGAGPGLLIADSGNHTLRRLFTNAPFGTFTVETSAGQAGQSGLANGATNLAKFNSPIGLAPDPLNGAFLIVDSGNGAVRRVQQSPPLPAIDSPQIGYVILAVDPITGQTTTQLVPVTQAVFNNEVPIAILAEAGVETYFSSGSTPPNAFEDTVPNPTSATGLAPLYRNGGSSLPPSLISPVQPDLTIKSISSMDGRRPSPVVKARFQFKTATPDIAGDNAASFRVSNLTTGAKMYYTIDGSDPTNGLPSLGPIASGDPLSLNLGTSNLLFKVIAFRDHFLPSAIVSNLFTPSNFVANRITFGFDGGEASSTFVGSPGQRFYAPVTLTLLPEQRMMSLQFAVNARATNGSPAVAPGAVGFTSHLEKPDPINNGFFLRIPPLMFSGSSMSNLLFTNVTQNLIGVGWLETPGKTNLFDTGNQDLITYSRAHNHRFLSTEGRVVVGSFAFTIPPVASVGQQYTIQLSRPSATADGQSADVFIETPTNGSLTATAPVNAVKLVTVGQAKYIVGDAEPFRWFNAGDFGDGSLLSADVLQIFQAAAYFVNRPPAGSDFFDAMDSSNGSSFPVYNGSDASVIDAIALGDGALNVDDIFVTFRRSLDPTLKWYRRFWSGGVRVAEAVTNTFRTGLSAPLRAKLLTETPTNGEPAAVTFIAGDAIATAGGTLEIPITARISGGYPIRVLMLNLRVNPLDDSPPVTTAVRFTPVPALGPPFTSSATGPGNCAGVWLDHTVAGITGTNLVGTLIVTVPPNAAAGAAYAISFEHASASPNGPGLLPRQIVNGLLTLRDRSGSSPADGIPDAWRLRHFGSVSNLLAAALADADGDGLSNLAEFRAGTDPNDALSHFHMRAARGTNAHPHEIVLRWPTAFAKNYVLESSPSLFGTNWTAVITNVPGNGWDREFRATNSAAGPLFYRVRLVE